MDLPLVVGGGGWGITIKSSTPTVHFGIQLQTSKGHLAFNTWGILLPAQRLHSTCDMPVCSTDFAYIN